MESRRARQMDAARAGQGVKELRFELPALVGGDGLRAFVTRYPFGEQGSGYRVRRDVLQGVASGRRVKRSTAVRQYLKPSDVGSGPTMSMYTCPNRDVGKSKSPSGVRVPGQLRPLARPACSCPGAAVLHARPHESLGNEFCRCPCSEVTKPVEGD
jgi:hypothetical protein